MALKHQTGEMIKVIDKKISKSDLAALCAAHFKSMVKFVVDVQRMKIAVGGEMHADAEDVLLRNGSRQVHLWGGNFYPWNNPEDRVEFTSFINIRPMDDNASMEILNGDIRTVVMKIVQELLLSPDESMESELK